MIAGEPSNLLPIFGGRFTDSVVLSGFVFCKILDSFFLAFRRFGAVAAEVPVSSLSAAPRARGLGVILTGIGPLNHCAPESLA
jgi:hypothetical protein